ncbi:MAG TPA: heat-inducible transcriptional repressor HrcA [Gammaproteobacteria bacterium]
MTESLPKLDDRSHVLLKTLVERYIADGQPVGSRTLAQDSGIVLSPATIRNVMVDLEEMGLVSSPHTSAGRVPTVQGYRVFIDTMLNIRPLDNKAVAELKKQLHPGLDNKMLIKAASTLLSDITHLAGIVMIPSRDAMSIRHIEFLPLSNRRILAILVINEKEIQNRILDVDRTYTASELQQAANYINQNLLGQHLKSVLEELKRELFQTQQELSGLMRLVVEVAGKVFEQREQEDLVVEGQTNLMGFNDLSDMDKLKQLFEAFNKKRDILHLLDRCQQAEGVQIFIGQESGYDVLDDCSVITSPYSVRGEPVGVLGVVGPTRMPYDRVIPIVDITAKLLSSALTQ